MSEPNSIWVTYGRTESGDDLEVIIWGAVKPTDEQVDGEYERLMPTEYEEVGSVNWTLTTATSKEGGQ